MKFSLSPLDDALTASLQEKIDRKTKPPGALGQLERLALKIGRIQQTLSPRFTNPHLLVFAADHGAARAGISAYPQDVSWQMLRNYLHGGAAANVFSSQHGLHMLVVDAGVAYDFGAAQSAHVEYLDAKIDPRGTRSYFAEAAMSTAQCRQALQRGAEIARRVCARGCNVMVFGEKGIGNTGAASLITHALTGAPLADCVGRGTGLDDAALARKHDLLRQTVQRAQLPQQADVMDVLREFGGFEIVMMAGAMLAAAERRTTLLIDGFITTAALLAAARMAPEIRDYCIFCHRSAEAGHRVQLRALGGEALLDLGLRLGEGTGALVAYPLVCAALSFLNDMTSFASAGVSEGH